MEAAVGSGIRVWNSSSSALAFPSLPVHLNCQQRLRRRPSVCRVSGGDFPLAAGEFMCRKTSWMHRRSAYIDRAPSKRAGVKVRAGEGAAPGGLPDALLFDCDGVLVDTEKDGHRISFNIAFSEKGLDTVWDVDLYGELLKIGGGKERMTHYFNKFGWPDAAPKEVDERREFIATLHKNKTNLFMDLVEGGSLPLRPGVASLIDQAMDNGVLVAVCSTSNEKAVSAIVRVMLGPERAKSIQIFAGDVVPRKKPDPAVYLLAAQTLGVSPERCVVVEDSHIGVSAAKGAGMKCIVTKSGYTEDENFSEADAVFDSIGDSPASNFDLNFAGSLLESTAKSVA